MTQHYWFTLMVALSGLAMTSRCPAAPLSEHARDFREQLATKIMPYWFDTAQDTNHGGYLMADDLKGRGVATEKQLVSQARMVWGFSHAHLKGYSTAQRNYLSAARQGYQFLLDHFLDREQGGYYWKTDLAGQVTNNRKIVYGQSFVVYALVEYYRASQDKAALRQAMDLYQTLQQRAHDAKHGGWVEHFERDWTPLKLRDPKAEVEVAGLKSANTHLHYMEALTELYEASRDPGVKKSLEEAVKINCDYFYPLQPGQSAFHRQPDWSAVTDPRSAGLSYGHNVEFAWLMIRAEKTLGRTPSWPHFRAHIDHALKYGYDHQLGGLYALGNDDQPATKTDKVWWVEAEMMAALIDGLLRKKNAEYTTALDQLIHFVLAHQVDAKDGIWLDTVSADGQPKSGGKAHSWKANYHDVRAIVKFVEAFGVPVK
ncbi:MAG: AGE family epimerase/isomerase [Verrucomicrobia bacterium]|nr:AGE family epimerase/isomerase [Verrucomicrobiota bacterium]